MLALFYSVLEHSFNIGQTVYSPALAFTVHLCGAWRWTRGESLRFSGFFLIMFPALGMCMDSSIIQYKRELLKAFISLHTSFPNLLLPNFWSVHCLYSLQTLAPGYCDQYFLPLHTFWKYHLALGIFQIKQNDGKPLHWSKLTTTILWE